MHTYVIMLRSTFASLREYLTPLPQSSSFQKTGEITPEEFVKAGDYLVYRFPTWSWAPASPGKRRDFLPEDKQVLVTRHVPCAERVVEKDPALAEVDDTDDWVVSSVGATETAKISETSESSGSSESSGKVEALEVTDLDADNIDLDEMGISEDDLEDFDVNKSKERSYNVYITYSASYRVPRAYLSGFDSNGTQLPPKLMFEDIVKEYRDKTVTIEQAPFQSNLTLVSIHPCRHAGVMRMLLDMADAKLIEESRSDEGGDDWEEVPGGVGVDKYLVVFLKFIASVTPTIQYDFTMSAL